MDEQTKRIDLRLPAELYRALEAVARREERSINGQIVYTLRQMVAADEAAQQERAAKLAA